MVSDTGIRMNVFMKDVDAMVTIAFSLRTMREC
jgi:hypothetical protein